MEYLHHFQLNDDPFRNDHVERFATTIPSQTDAIARLDRAVRQGRGLVTVVGGAGAGKTAVAKHLYEELEEEVFEASMMVVLRSHADSDWLLQRFAAQLGVEEPAQQRESLIGQIYERLAIIREDGRHAVLIIDDAQALATPETLAELCALVRLEYEERRMLSIVLAGTPALAATLSQCPELAHHVEVQVRLQGLDIDEAGDYLGARVRAAGGEPELLLPGAVAALHETAEGAPGRMNILADNALYEAYAAGRPQVARSDVERAYTSLSWDRLSVLERDAGPLPIEAIPAVNSGAADAMAEAPALDFAPSLDLDAAPENLAANLERAHGENASRPTARLASHSAAQLDAVFDTASSTPVESYATERVAFEAVSPPVPPHPVAAVDATEIQLETVDVLPDDGPPKDHDEDAVDALFMELIDD